MDSNNSAQNNRTYHPILAGLGTMALAAGTALGLGYGAGKLIKHFADPALKNLADPGIAGKTAIKLAKGIDYSAKSPAIMIGTGIAGGVVDIGNAIRVGRDRSRANETGSEAHASMLSGIGVGTAAAAATLGTGAVVSMLKKL